MNDPRPPVSPELALAFVIVLIVAVFATICINLSLIGGM